MEIKITYPIVDKKKIQRRMLIKWTGWPILLVAIISVITNVLVGGLMWSVVVVAGLYMFWHLILATDLIEYNRISQFIKLSIYSCILILLIDLFLIGGWALEVISIVVFCSVLVSVFMLFTDFNRQRQNLFPMFFLIVLGLIWATVGLLSMDIKRWILICLAAIATLSLISILIVLKGDFLKELRCRFHLK